jgi:hypothetical protein
MASSPEDESTPNSGGSTLRTCGSTNCDIALVGCPKLVPRVKTNRLEAAQILHYLSTSRLQEFKECLSDNPNFASIIASVLPAKTHRRVSAASYNRSPNELREANPEANFKNEADLSNSAREATLLRQVGSEALLNAEIVDKMYDLTLDSAKSTAE